MKIRPAEVITMCSPSLWTLLISRLGRYLDLALPLLQFHWRQRSDKDFPYLLRNDKISKPNRSGAFEKTWPFQYTTRNTEILRSPSCCWRVSNVTIDTVSILTFRHETVDHSDLTQTSVDINNNYCLSWTARRIIAVDCEGRRFALLNFQIDHNYC